VKFPLAQVGKEAVMITGGFVLGMYAITGFAHVRSLQKYRNYYGIMHIVLGTLGVGCSKKNPYLRSLSIAFASAGLYDLVACNVKQLGLPTMHTGGEHPAVAAAEGAVSTTTLANAAAATPPASQNSGMGTSYGSNFRGDFIDALIDD
jgi:hypothetical protein